MRRIDEADQGLEMSMIGSQLGRTLLGGADSDPDEHRASPDEGGYGDLMDAIDEAIERLTTDPDPSG
jgi:hypothetical protein